MYVQNIDDAVVDLARDNQRSNRVEFANSVQRRNPVVDTFGMDYTRQTDGKTPIRFHISISPDMVYYSRFEFKLEVQKFRSTVVGLSEEVVKVNESTVQVDNAETVVNTTNLTINQPSNTITPNPHTHTTNPHNHTTQPHTHTTDPHTHKVNYGIHELDIEPSEFKMFVDDVDVTPYLQELFHWVDGEGVFPSEEVTDNFDLIKICNYLDEADRKKIIESGHFMRIRIETTEPCMVIMYPYVKYNHTGRH